MRTQNPVIRIYKVFRWVMLIAVIGAILLAIQEPARPPKPDPAMSASYVDQFESKILSLETARRNGESGASAEFTSSEVNAALANSLALTQQVADEAAGGTEQSVPAERVPVKETRVSFEDDIVTGYFLTELYGKDVYITISGKLGSQDGYVTFTPTSFKVGDLIVPVSMVDPALQKKLAEPANREKLKLPEFVSDLKVENGLLVITEH